jgi:hypothetical protein
MSKRHKFHNFNDGSMVTCSVSSAASILCFTASTLADNAAIEVADSLPRAFHLLKPLQNSPNRAS